MNLNKIDFSMINLFFITTNWIFYKLKILKKDDSHEELFEYLLEKFSFRKKVIFLIIYVLIGVVFIVLYFSIFCLLLLLICIAFLFVDVPLVLIAFAIGLIKNSYPKFGKLIISKQISRLIKKFVDDND